MRLTRALAAVAAVLLTSACAAADKAPADTAETAATPTATSTPAVVTITAKDFSYDAPDTIAAGMVTLRLVNQGPEMHHVQLLRLDDGKTFADLSEGLKGMKPGAPPPPWVHDVAGPNTPMPGAETSLTENLPAGNYAVICMIPSADGTPHAMKGMIKALTVIPSTGTAAAAPVADVTVKMTDYAWQVTPALTAGKHVIQLENDAEQSHEMLLVQLAPGKEAADLSKWLIARQGPPPGKPIGGISGMAKGGVAYLPVDLEPGEYGLYCFLPDAKDGKPHVDHGMIRQLTVN